MAGSKTNKVNFKTFFVKVILPSFLSVLLFVLLIFNFIIPFFKDNMLNSKKEMIRELVNSTMGIADKYYKLSVSGEMTVEDAKNSATKEIASLRYGAGLKDYFWITDFEPRMINHPYRPDLNNKNISKFKDPQGKLMFVAMVNVVRKNGHGYVDYMWQWMDDSTKIVPKISYVKEFKPWGWIIGTGIYIEDVNQEISKITYNLTVVSLIIASIITLMLIIILRQFYKTEINRLQTGELLKISREKYKAMVESSSEAKMMIIDKEIVHLNNRISEMFSHSTISGFADDFSNLSPKDKIISDEIHQFVNDDTKEIQFESTLQDINNHLINAIVTISKIMINTKSAFIITFKEISEINDKQTIIRYDELSGLIEELKSDYSKVNRRNEELFSLSIRKIIQEPMFCSSDASLSNIINQMKFNDISAVIILSDESKPLGIITQTDILKNLLSVSENENISVLDIMSSPLVSITYNSLNYYSLMTATSSNIHHLPITDNDGKITGIIKKEDIFNLIKYSEDIISFMISKSETIFQLSKERKKSFIHLDVMLESGANVRQLSKSITHITGLIQKRIIENIFNEIGNAPVPFAIISLGSEGRKEQSLTSDQDNALIFDNSGINNKNITDYFKMFAGKYNHYLNKVGFEYCDGDVMAKNPKWNQPLKVWYDYFSEWISNSTPENILETEIFFDLRTIYGDLSFETSVREHINKKIAENPNFLNILARHCTTYKIPVNFFGNLQTENFGESHDLINIKNPLRIIVNLVRLFSIKQNLNCTNTIKRIESLTEAGIFSKELANDLKYAYNYLMFIQLKFQVFSFMNGQPVTNYVDKKNLTSIEINTVKYILSVISTLQTKIKFDFGINE
ncbi:MAG: cache domain-containing protein [Candidatus Kapabacteria bacterium]|nr:cache domain-containing protein [Candidatus Kapabacteria bacterium]